MGQDLRTWFHIQLSLSRPERSPAGTAKPAPCWRSPCAGLWELWAASGSKKPGVGSSSSKQQGTVTALMGGKRILPPPAPAPRECSDPDLRILSPQRPARLDRCCLFLQLPARPHLPSPTPDAAAGLSHTHGILRSSSAPSHWELGMSVLRGQGQRPQPVTWSWHGLHAW